MLLLAAGRLLAADHDLQRGRRARGAGVLLIRGYGGGTSTRRRACAANAACIAG